MDFKGLIGKTTNPAENLATEEYLLKKRSENIFFIYKDAPSIICGKHQNTYAETNFLATQSLNLKVYRRLSGGGTVYHDEGNLNFCFISNETNQHMIDFKRYSTLIIDYLKSIGVNAYFGGRNDFLIDGKKISGNACHVYKNRVMHHGTLLFNSNLKNLGESLKTDPAKYTDKAVKSVRSVVTNIADNLEEDLPINDFQQGLFDHVSKGNLLPDFTEAEATEIFNLATTKYATWEWNYGYSPDYKFKRRINLPQQKTIINVEMSVAKGIIQTITVSSNKEEETIEKEFNNLVGKQHKLETIKEVLQGSLSSLFNDYNSKSIIDQLF